MSESYSFTVEIYTDALQISGSYDLPLYRRVSDALNSRLHRFITLRDATIAPLWRAQQAQQVPQLLVDWSTALLVATVAEPPSPPGFQPPALPRDTQPMMCFTAAFALRADFHKRSDMDLVATLSELSDDFLALSNVTIFPLQGASPLSRSFVCLNRSGIQALYPLGAQIAHGPLPAAQFDLPASPFAPPPAPIPDLAPADEERPVQ